MPAARCASTVSCRVTAEQPSLGGHSQELVVISGALPDRPVPACHHWIRREEKFEALHVTRGRAVALVHIAAADALRARRHPDLVARPVIADRRAHRVGAVATVVARLRRVRPTNAAAGMDGVVPVIVMIRGHAIPTAVMRFDRVMRPAETGVAITDDDALPGKAERPDIRCMRVSNALLDGVGLVYAAEEPEPPEEDSDKLRTSGLPSTRAMSGRSASASASSARPFTQTALTM